jgi:hypothetical protein
VPGPIDWPLRLATAFATALTVIAAGLIASPDAAALVLHDRHADTVVMVMALWLAALISFATATVELLVPGREDAADDEVARHGLD